MAPGVLLDCQDRVQADIHKETLCSVSEEAIAEKPTGVFTVEQLVELMFSANHLKFIFASPTQILRFTAYLSSHRSQSIPVLIYYLDIIKAINAVHFANAISEGLGPLKTSTLVEDPPQLIAVQELTRKAEKAFLYLVEEDLPAYITQIYTNAATKSVMQIMVHSFNAHPGALHMPFKDSFFLTDPSQPNNPIVFASAGFHHTTFYDATEVFGRNCSFLQGPRTSLCSTRRFEEAFEQGKPHSEVVLNYRQDGFAFLNLLAVAPLYDSHGKLRYFMGACIDVSSLTIDGRMLESFQTLIYKKLHSHWNENPEPTENDGQYFDNRGIHGARSLCFMSRDSSISSSSGRPGGSFRERLIHGDQGIDARSRAQLLRTLSPPSCRGPYQHYLLLRPAPSFAILFAAPALRVPGLLQSPFLERLGGPTHIRNGLAHALTAGCPVTARVRWDPLTGAGGGLRGPIWLRCTPLRGPSGGIGVWVVVLVEDVDLRQYDESSGKNIAPPGERRRQRCRPEVMLRHDEWTDGYTRDNWDMQALGDEESDMQMDFQGEDRYADYGSDSDTDTRTSAERRFSRQEAVSSLAGCTSFLNDSSDNEPDQEETDFGLRVHPPDMQLH